jgi:hypothetical protein
VSRQGNEAGQLRRSLLRAVLAAASLSLPVAAHADGVADLKAALARLPGTSPVKASIEATTWSRAGEGKEKDEQHGYAAIEIEEGPRGLQLRYARELMQRAEDEERAHAQDPNAPTPAGNAMGALGASEVRRLIGAAPALARAIDQASFTGERVEPYEGRPARRLSFTLGIDALGAKDRKYVKTFEGALDVWIDSDGTPLASRARRKLSGRALLVISFDVGNDEDHVYAVTGDRLVSVRRELRSSGSGAGEKGESRTVHTVKLQT